MENVSEKLPSVENKAAEIFGAISGEKDAQPLEDGFEEGAGDLMYNSLQEACNFYGEDYTRELISRLRERLEAEDDYSQRIEDALEAMLTFEADKGWDI